MKIKVLIIFILFAFNSKGQVSENTEIQNAIRYYEKGDFNKSKALFEGLISSNKELSTKDKIQIFNNLGNIYADQGKNPKSLQYYQKALRFSRKINDKLDEGKILKNIGALFLSWKKLDKAEVYYFKALDIAKKTKDKKLLADCYNNIGTVYEQLNQLDKAENVYLNALSIYKKLNSLPDIAMSYSNLAIVLKLKGDKKESIKYNSEALKIAEKEKDMWLVAAISNNIGNAYTEIYDFKQAEFYCKQGLKIADSIDAIEISIMALESLANMFEKKGDFKQASTLYKKMIARNNEFINKTQTEQFSEMEIKFKTKEKELENRQLRLEKDQSWRKTIFIIALISFGFLVLFSIYFSISRINKQKALNQKQREMNLAVIRSENKERFRIARDLHDSVGQMLSALKMQLPQDEPDSKILTLVDQTILEVRQISHNLIPEALNFGLKRAFEELHEKLSKNLQIDFILEQNYDTNSLKLDKEKQLMVLRVMQEIISNTLKHAEANRMELQINIEVGNIQIHFKENGKGFDPKIINSSNGLGWKNIDARLAFLNGRMDVISNKNYGTNIKLVIPNEQ